MRFALIALCAASLLPAVPSKPVDDHMAWGETVRGLRIGVGTGPSSPESQLRVVLQNTGKVEVPVVLGSRAEQGAVYNFVFTIRTPSGQESDLFNFNGPPGIQHQSDPIIVHIAPGKQYEVLLPMKKFIAIENGKNRTLPELLAAHYSVRVSLDTTGDPRQLRPIAFWMGQIASGDFKN